MKADFPFTAEYPFPFSRATPKRGFKLLAALFLLMALPGIYYLWFNKHRKPHWQETVIMFPQEIGYISPGTKSFRGDSYSNMPKEEMIKAFEEEEIVLLKPVEYHENFKLSFMHPKETNSGFFTTYYILALENPNDSITRVFFAINEDDASSIKAISPRQHQRSERVAGILDGETANNMPFELSSGVYVFKATFSNDYITAEAKTLRPEAVRWR